ncbi:hypothetical protein HOLleu_21907 [Holothuria leucospilota]|uniref:Uncharacterized protein n=1 Tax=Holothuria leucospilota TaxID=206669 RepID=A0A9Q1H6T4_HOLLE|nr:hypothetical protein HOLleu_21907 [Holothuria leucospilota]
MWMHYSQQMISIIYGRGQRLSKVTGSETTKTLEIACKPSNIMMNTFRTWVCQNSYTLGLKYPCESQVNICLCLLLSKLLNLMKPFRSVSAFTIAVPSDGLSFLSQLRVVTFFGVSHVLNLSAMGSTLQIISQGHLVLNLCQCETCGK